MLNKLVKWVAFGIVLAVLPLVIDYFGYYLSNQGKVISWHEVIKHGQLMLINAGIAGAAIGELVGSGSKWQAGKIAATVTCVAVVMIGGSVYAFASGLVRQHGEHFYASQMIVQSEFFFWLTVLASCGCVLLAQEEKKNANKRSRNHIPSP